MNIMNKLKTYNIAKNNLTTNISNKINKIDVNKISDNGMKFLNTKGYHFQNLDKNIKKQLYNCINTYLSNNCIEHYYYFFVNYIKCEFKNIEDKVGLDYGCWFNLSTLIYSLFNNKKIYCTDIYDKNIINEINNQVNNNTINYYNLNELDKINYVDWIILYDVLDSYICDGDINIDFSNKLKYFRDILNDDGILVITDFEETSKIKLEKLELLVKIYFMNYKIYYNNDNCRFVIVCYRNNLNNKIINLRSFSYTGTSFMCRKIADFIDGNNVGIYFNNNTNDSLCSNCKGKCKLEYIYNLGKTHIINNNLYNINEIKKYYNGDIMIYISRYIYSLIYSYKKNMNCNLDNSIIFWIKAMKNTIPNYDYIISYEKFTNNFKKELVNFCNKFKLKYNDDFCSKRCHLYNKGNPSELLYHKFVNGENINNIKYEKIFKQEQEIGIIPSDYYKNKLSKNDFNIIYKKILTKNIDKKYYDLNIVVPPEKCFETYFLFNTVGCKFKKSNIYNKDQENYSILIEESEIISNHYIQRNFNNIKENINFEVEFLIKTIGNYKLIIQFQNKNNKIINKQIIFDKYKLYKDNFYKININLNSGYGKYICNLKIILIYNNDQNYLGNKNRLIEFII